MTFGVARRSRAASPAAIAGQTAGSSASPRSAANARRFLRRTRARREREGRTERDKPRTECGEGQNRDREKRQEDHRKVQADADRGRIQPRQEGHAPGVRPPQGNQCGCVCERDTRHKEHVADRRYRVECERGAQSPLTISNASAKAGRITPNNKAMAPGRRQVPSGTAVGIGGLMRGRSPGFRRGQSGFRCAGREAVPEMCESPLAGVRHPVSGLVSSGRRQVAIEAIRRRRSPATT